MSRIMLVDDDGDMARITGRWLEKAGHEVTLAASGKEALSLVEGVRPDLIILDYAMPEMDGPAVFEALRSDPGNKTIPVIFRTGKDDGDSEEILNRLRPDGIVLKSEGKVPLMDAVGKLLPG